MLVKLSLVLHRVSWTCSNKARTCCTASRQLPHPQPGVRVCVWGGGACVCCMCLACVTATACSFQNINGQFLLCDSKTKGFENEERLVYQIIEDAGNKGTQAVYAYASVSTVHVYKWGGG